MYPQVQGDTELAIDVELSNKNFCLDDPKQRQHYTKYMSAKKKERFAKCYVRSLLETKEKVSLVSSDDQSIAPQNL
jgi:hypothetical protein